MGKKRANQPGYVKAKGKDGRTIWVPHNQFPVKRTVIASKQPTYTSEGNEIFEVEENGVVFNVVIVREKDFFKRQENRGGGIQVNDFNEDIAVVYDSRYKKGFGTEGQQVSHIPLRSAGFMSKGWMMYGGVSEWFLSGETMGKIAEFYEPKYVEISEFSAPNVKNMLDALHMLPDSLQIRFEDGSIPVGVRSWRGEYSELTIITDKNDENRMMTVKNLKKIFEDSLGKSFTGYKGGSFVMNEDSLVYCDGYGEAEGKFIVGINDDGTLVLSEPEDDNW